ncbi:MAG: autoinducer 2 ABC transporter substrate-binding protein, partial [Gemmobacter sp.]
PYVASDCVRAAVLWDTTAMGYAAMQALHAAANGTLKAGDTSFAAGALGTLQILNGSQILLGAPTVFTKENITNYDF